MVTNQFIPSVNLDLINSARNIWKTDSVNKSKSEDVESINGPGDFGSVLKNELDKVNNYQVNNEQNIEKYLNGEDIDMYEVMVSAKEASTTLQMAVEIRNKLVDAYLEISRMQI